MGQLLLEHCEQAMQMTISGFRSETLSFLSVEGDKRECSLHRVSDKGFLICVLK